jgi:hypothetical protein
LLYGSSKHARIKLKIDGTHLKEKGLHITARLGIANFLASSVWVDRFKRRYNNIYRTLWGESRSADPETAGDWKNNRLAKN